MQVETLFGLQSLPRMRNLEILGSLLMSNTTPQVMVLPDIQVAAILITRSPEVDPEVDLKVDHLMGHAAPLLLVTRVHSGNRVHSGDKVCDGDRSREKDHRSDCGSYYPDDCDRYHPNYNRYCDKRFYDFYSRYYGWVYDRRYDERGAYWSLPHRFTPPVRSDDHCSVDLRDMCPWGDPSFRDRCKSSHHNSRDHHRERCSKCPSKPEHSQSCSPEYKE